MRKQVVHKFMAWLFYVSLLLCAIAAPMPQVVHAGDPSTSSESWGMDNYWPGEVIVKFGNGQAEIRSFPASSFTLSTENTGIELEQLEVLHDGAILYRTNNDVLSTLSALAQDPRVEYVQPHYIYHLFTASEPDDPYWADRQWDMHLDHWGIDLTDAWSYTQGSADVVVGIVDSGVDYYHEDLHIDSGRLLVLPGSNFMVTPDKDGNTPMDGMNNGHGTHVAGTIAASANNGVGIAGIAPQARIMPIKAGPDDTEVLYFVEEGVQFAGDHGAKIVNLSLGGNGCGNSLLYGLIQAYPDVLFVAAAGNNGVDLAEFPVFPAIFTADSTCFGTPYSALPNIMTVASVDNNGHLSYFSNFSDTYVNLAAPGSKIFSLLPRNKSGDSRYDTKQGTSMATPHVSGAAALIYSLAPDLTPAEVIDIMELTVTPSADLIGKVKTGGTLNAGVAVAYTANRIKPVTTDRSGAVASGTTVTLSTYTDESDIYYTLDGSEPIFADGVVISGEHYDEPIVIDAPVTLKARAYKDGMLRSETAEFTYSILSNSTDLSSLWISSGLLSPAFDTTITNYTANVSHSTDSLSVTAATYDPHAVIQINDHAPASSFASAQVALSVGTNDIAVKVTAEDSVATNTYNISIVRPERDDNGNGDDGGDSGDDSGQDNDSDGSDNNGNDDGNDDGNDNGDDNGQNSDSDGSDNNGNDNGDDHGQNSDSEGSDNNGNDNGDDHGQDSGSEGSDNNGNDNGDDHGQDSGNDGSDNNGNDNGDDHGQDSGSNQGSQADITTPVPSAQSEGDPATLVIHSELDIDTNVAKAVLNQEAWNSALENATVDNNGFTTISLVIPTLENATAYELTLPQSSLISSDVDTRLTIVTDFASITLPGNMIVQNSGDSNATVSLRVARLDASQIANTETRSLIGERPIIQVELRIGEKFYSWSNPFSSVEISIPYTPTQEEQAALEHLVIRYIDPTGETIDVPSGHYDPNTEAVSFTVAHFSEYAIAFVRKSFNDLKDVPWAQKPIEVLAAKGVVQGDGAHSFFPGNNITRADFLLMLVRMLGLMVNDNSSLPGFSDVAATAYYADAVNIAQKLGIAAGSGGGRFHPDDFISRQDMMVLTVRALHLSGEWGEEGEAALESFIDKDVVAEYALDSLAFLVRNGLIVGDGGKLRPRHFSSRAEAAVLLYQVYNMVFFAQK